MTSNSTPLRIPKLPIESQHQDLFNAACIFVHEYMCQPGHDSSHDWQHILRVLSNTNRLYTAELKANPSASYDTTLLFLAALLHDVGDRKYAKPGEDVENQISFALTTRGATQELADKVQILVKHVSYSHETKNPKAVQDTLEKYPELAIVQDADRLDAIGAIGVARCLTYGGAKYPHLPMTRAIDHFDEKLYKLEGMMKTASGKVIAEQRTRVLENFAKDFQSEAELSFDLS